MLPKAKQDQKHVRKGCRRGRLDRIKQTTMQPVFTVHQLLVHISKKQKP